VASDLVSAEMVARPFPPTSLMMGVIRPVGVATATQMSAFLYLMDTCTNQVLCQTWTERVQKEGGRGGVQERGKEKVALSDDISHPGGVGLGNISEGEGGGLDDWEEARQSKSVG
jgi:hypothetical protein